MEAERWREINRLYHLALELEESARVAFLERLCAGDKSLEQEVLSLLEHAEGTGSFLEEPALEVAAKALAMTAGAGAMGYTGDNDARPLPAAIGRYRIIRLLGEGGMGTVYEAEQEQPRRPVALKIIKPGLAVGERLWRFEHEAQALGRLQHPGIAQIYEASTADTGFGPQPYFAMELIRGPSLQEYAKANSLNSRQRLALMVKICEAVNHAHLRGLIHRDLKPDNILVDETGQPKILDFGVARVTASDEHATRQTDLGRIVGTLAYMSPEQVLADPLELDTRSDVYSLGVILYQLLSGRLPYNVNQRPLHVAVQAIREDDPTSLRLINRDYRGDVETIVGKALEKDKARRYVSAAELAADIQRYLEDQPIAARPPSSSYQLQKFARRHKALVAGVAAVFVVLAGGVVASTSQAIRANRAGRAALTERDRASAAQRAATQERDRALNAEAAATSERNRALAAEAQVVQQRDRVLLEKKRADDEAATALAVNNFLQNDLLSQASARVQSRPDTKPNPDLKVRTALDRAAAGIQGKFDRQPSVEASIRQTIGKAYFDLGVYREAQRHWERAVELRRRVLGADHPDTLTSMNDLADAYRVQSAYKQAEPLFTKVLETRRRVQGDENPDTLSSMNELANLYLDQARYPLAEPLLVKAWEVQRRVLGPDHPDTLTTLHDLATTYLEEGKFGLAEPLFIQALDARRRVLGGEHPQTARTMNELGWLYRQEGKLPQAEALLIEAVEVQRRVLGEEHSDTLTSMNNLAVVYRTEGKYDQAEAIYIRVLEIRRRVLGAEHANTLISMNNLAVLYSAEGKLAQAEILYSGAIDIQRRLFGEENPTTLHFVSNLGALYRREGKYAQADAALTRVVQDQRRLLGEAHPDTLRSMNDLAVLYHDEGKDEMAEPLLIKALELRRRVLGPANPDTLSTMGALAEVELKQQKCADAEPLLREAVSTTEKTGPDTWNRYYLQALLGASLAGQKRFAEAEPLLVSGREGMLQRQATVPTDNLSRMVQAGQRIVELYESWGKLEKAAEWRQKVQAK
jgi:eukaryotic-like serine/threonine-protein kinase